jgi:UDP-glucose 4-epimerase
MNILVIGGAGYIGSFISRTLVEKGYHVTVFDNLHLGHRAAVGKDISFVEGDLADRAALDTLFRSRRFDGVMHFAAFSAVGESMVDPLAYYGNNVANTINLLSAMKDAHVERFIFSSSAAVFGNPLEVPITETHPQNPINPYGEGKSMVERIMRDGAMAYDLRYVSLRYFNAAGASPEGDMGEDHRRETHLIPLALKAILGEKAGGTPLRIFGDDYDTPDGTCIRDYIHVLDLADAHVLALEYLLDGGESDIFNLGNGKGFSVSEVVKTAEKVAGKSVPTLKGDRRAGDPPVLVAGSEKITKKLGWTPLFPGLEAIIETAWKWHESHPKGYGA